MSVTSTVERAAPMRRFRPHLEYKDSGVAWLGMIPAHWEVKRLKNCVQKLESGGTPESDNFEYWTDDEVGTPWVAISDMTRAFHVRQTAKRLTERGLRSKRLPILPAGTLLYSMYASLGKVALLEIDAVVNQAILGVVPRDGVASRTYLRWWLEFMHGHVQLLSSSNTQDNLNADKVRKMPVFVPNPDAQSAIAAFLDRETAEIDGLVAKKERLIELLQEQRTAVITRAVTNGLDPKVPLKDSGVEWLGKIPAHWEVKPLKYFLRAPLAYGVLKPDKYLGEGGVRLIRILDVESGEVREDALDVISPEQSEEFRRTIVGAGDVVVSVVGTIGRAFVAPKSLAGANLSRALARVQLKPMLTAHFLEAVFGSSPFASFVELVPGGTAQRVLNLGDLGEYPMAAPPTREQESIVSFLALEKGGLDHLIVRVRDAIERLEEFRTSLISAAVTGKIDVREEAA